MLTPTYNAGAVKALATLGLVKYAEMESFMPPSTGDMFEDAMRMAPPVPEGPLTPPNITRAAAPAVAETGSHTLQAGKGLTGFARRNPLLAGGLALGSAVGIGMGAHGLMTGRNIAPQPRTTYNYSGPANPML